MMLKVINANYYSYFNIYVTNSNMCICIYINIRGNRENNFKIIPINNIDFFFFHKIRCNICNRENNVV